MSSAQVDSRPEAARLNAGWLAIATGVSLVLNYCFSLALTRGLPAAEYAIYAAGQGLLLILGVAGSVAVPWVLAREVARSEANDTRRQTAVSFAFWLNVLGGAVVGVLMSLVSLAFAEKQTALVIGVATFTLAVGSTGMGYLQGVRRNGLLALVTVGEFALKVLAGTLFVFALDRGVTYVFVAVLIGALVPLSTCVLVRGDIGRPRLRSVDWELWRAAARIGGLQLIVAVFSSCDVVLVSIVGTTKPEAGAYQVAAALSRLPVFVAGAVSIAVFPLLARNVAAISHRVEALRSVMLVSIFIGAGLTSVPHGAIAAFFPADFSAVSGLLPLIVPAGVGLGLLNVLTTFSQSEDSTGPATKWLAASLLAYVCLLLLGGLIAGTRGMAIGGSAGIWLGVVLLGMLPTQRPACASAVRRVAAQPGRVALGLGFVVTALAVQNVVVWAGLFVLATPLVARMAFPELGARDLGRTGGAGGE